MKKESLLITLFVVTGMVFSGLCFAQVIHGFNIGGVFPDYKASCISTNTSGIGKCGDIVNSLDYPSGNVISTMQNPITVNKALVLNETATIENQVASIN